MKKTLTTLAALAACAGTQLFAQNAKTDVVSFSLTTYAQSSVSTSPTVRNAGLWSQGPQYYKTANGKLNTTGVLQAIAIVLHGTPGYYSKFSNPQLVLVQGELTGFFGYPYVATLDDTDTTDGDNIRFAEGRNMTNNPIDGALPPGHNQPWGQFFVQGNDTKGNATLCENVSFFFAIQVQECYDCFYLNSFISDATFTFTQQKGPPCCAGSAVTKGSGTDKYYMTLQFDNTINNPYLNPTNFISVQVDDAGTLLGSVAGSTNLIPIINEDEFYANVGGIDGLYPGVIGLVERDNGVNPDGLAYTDSITSTVNQPIDHHSYDIYTLRFALNGVMQYRWNLTFINKGDPFPDFNGTGWFGSTLGVGVGTATGYGYLAKVCTLFNGSVIFNEKVIAATKCCLNEPWFSPGSGQDGGFWFGIGDNDIGGDLASGTVTNNFSGTLTGAMEDYFNTSFPGHLGDDVPVNTDLDLSLHINFNYGYDPLKQATESIYPQPAFEGTWDDVPDPNISPSDVPPPQDDGRPADGSVD